MTLKHSHGTNEASSPLPPHRDVLVQWPFREPQQDVEPRAP